MYGSENTGRKSGRSRDVRRMTMLDRAATLMGGQEAMADAMGINSRQMRRKIAAESPIEDADLRLASAALTARANRVREFAERLTSLITEQGDS